MCFAMAYLLGSEGWVSVGRAGRKRSDRGQRRIGRHGSWGVHLVEFCAGVPCPTGESLNVTLYSASEPLSDIFS